MLSEALVWKGRERLAGKIDGEPVREERVSHGLPGGIRGRDGFAQPRLGH
jgi:hypothetical protein